MTSDFRFYICSLIQTLFGTRFGDQLVMLLPWNSNTIGVDVRVVDTEEEGVKGIVVRI